MTTPETYDGYVKYGPDEAATYDATRTNEDLWHFENDFVQKYFSNLHPSRILDAPVGTGRFLHYYPRTSHIIGLDISEHMLARAQQRLNELSLPYAEIVQGDIFSINYDTGYFDYAVCWRLLHLLPSEMLVPALIELRRVVRGELIVQVYIRGANWRRFCSRGARAIMRLLGRAPKTHPHRTSTHIRSYIHTRQTFESALAYAKLITRRSHVLGYYYGHNVCVYVLERTK